MSLLKINKKSDNFNKYVSWYLIASYIYYHRVSYEPPMSDSDYDYMCKVLMDNYEDIDHPHKHLVDLESLRAGTGFNLKEDEYPLIVKHSALGLYL